MHYVRKDKKIIEQIEALCSHYRFSHDVQVCIKEIAHNAYIKGAKTKELNLKLCKNVNNI
jgi:hypothetical protein